MLMAVASFARDRITRYQVDLELKSLLLQDAGITGLYHCIWLQGCGLTVFILVFTCLWAFLAQSMRAVDCYDLDLE